MSLLKGSIAIYSFNHTFPPNEHMIDVFSKRNHSLASHNTAHVPDDIRRRVLHTVEIYLSRGKGFGGFNEMLENVGDELVILYGGLAAPLYDAARISDHPVIQHFMSCDDEQALDYIEVCFASDSLLGCDEAVDTVNAILRDGDVGFQLTPFIKREGMSQIFGKNRKSYTYDPPRVVSTDSDFLEEEALRPALSALSAPDFQGASEEFLRALEHHRKGLFPESLNECLKCFESTLKIIAHKHSWPYKQTDTASRLIQLCIDRGLVSSASQQQLSSIRTLLESGIPTLRNKRSGHGQGIAKNDVPEHIAKYALNMTASTVIFLVESSHRL